jgi:hypothetical protein
MLTLKCAGVLNFPKGVAESLLQPFALALEDLEAAGAILVNTNDRPSSPENFGQMSYGILKHEFKDSLNVSMVSTSAEQVTTRTL